MKTVFMLLVFSAFTVYAYGQKVAIPTGGPTDTVRAKINKNTKTQQVKGVTMHANKDIVQNLATGKAFSKVYNAIRAAGLIGTFKSKGPITFFAPTNEAFKHIPKARLDTLMKKSHLLELCSLLTCHAVPGRITVKMIEKQIKSADGKASLLTLSGCKIFATMDGENIILTDELGNKSRIEPDDSDIEQSNGLIHVINNILVPKTKAI